MLRFLHCQISIMSALREGSPDIFIHMSDEVGMQFAAHGERKYRGTTLLIKSAQLTNIRVEQRRLEPGHHKPGVCRSTELAFVLSGSTMTVQSANGVTYRRFIQAGASCVCPIGTYEKASGTTSAIDCLHLYLSPDLIKRRAMADYCVDPSKIELRYTGGVDDPTLYQIAMAIRLILKTDETHNRLFYDGMQAVLAAHLIENYSVERWRRHVSASTIEYKAFKRVYDYIEEHFAEDVSLEDLAAEMGLSAYQFYRLFLARVGIAPHRYLSFRRVQEAQKLLELAKFTLDEIRQASGFRSMSEFYKVFRGLSGLTPIEYRHIRRS